MAEFDHGVKIIARTTGRYLARVAGLTCQRLDPLESTLQATTELLADRVFLARRGRERFVVYFEFYTTWNRHVPWDLLAKSALLSQQQRLPTACIVFILQPRGYRPQGEQFRLEVAGSPTQQLWFREVCLWQVDPQEWWEEVPGLMALYPLCRHQRPPREAIRHAADVIEQKLPDPGEQADGLFLLSIFGGLAYPQLDVVGIIGREKMKESKFAQEMRQEGRQEGRIENARENILDLLNARFGKDAAAEVSAAVNAIEQPKVLKQLLRIAGTCSALDKFRAALFGGKK
jgi:hypothetical protein